MSKLPEFKPLHTYETEEDALFEEIDHYKNLAEKYYAALEFYADINKYSGRTGRWYQDKAGPFVVVGEIMEDSGERARQVLGDNSDS